jgi:hypothetical protein
VKKPKELHMLVTFGRDEEIMIVAISSSLTEEEYEQLAEQQKEQFKQHTIKLFAYKYELTLAELNKRATVKFISEAEYQRVLTALQNAEQITYNVITEISTNKAGIQYALGRQVEALK